jgi:hypothetical protein
MAKSKYVYSAYGTFSEWTRYMYVLPASIPLFTSRIFSSTLSPMSRIKIRHFFSDKLCSGTGFRIRIHMFLGLQDPDPDPAPDPAPDPGPSIIKQK